MSSKADGPRRRTSARRALLAVALTVAVGVPVAWAGHAFTDVPSTNPHHDDISALYDARITTGCGGGNYCPELPVRRDQMASFLHRGLGRVAFNAGDYLPMSIGYQHLTHVTLFPGGAEGGRGLVKVDAAVNAFQPGGSDGPVRLAVNVLKQSAPGSPEAASQEMFETLMPTQPGEPNPNGSLTVSWVFPVPTIPQTYVLRARRDWGSGPLSARGSLVATYFPFGWNGGTEPMHPGVARGSDPLEEANRP